MQKYFVEPENFNTGYTQVFINKEDSFHIVKVMRMRIDEKIIIGDNRNSFLGKIVILDEKQVVVEIIEKLSMNTELSPKVTIAQGLIRKEKMEEVIEKITALGADEYIPVNMERSNIKIIDLKTKRLEKIIKEASEQSYRNHLMKIGDIQSFGGLLKKTSQYDVCLYASTKTIPNCPTFKEVLKRHDLEKLLIVIGPEGGISEKEEENLSKNGFLPISLGPRILRTELAPVYVMSSISYEKELGE